ncbi:MAG: phosphoribosylglycinamide formyltransferase [Ilumatobacter sp.]|uniref:phosphoribosylglycinamide formyltransferase n=1 Tax=Ilumatobacter sp. TaxID=1967498 RepID=UPI003296B44E
MGRPRIVVLISGTGSNLQAVVDACAAGHIGADVVGVVSNDSDAYGLVRADAAGIDTRLVVAHADESRQAYDTRLADAVASFDPDWVLLAGWMRLLTMAFLDRFTGVVVNLHPALPGELPGTRSIERAWAEALAGDRSSSGVMVHLVPDEGVDDGPTLGSRVVPVDTSGTLEQFATDVHDAEHALLVEVLASLCAPTTTDQEGPPT